MRTNGVKRIIMLKGAVETLEFFSMQMADSFAENGIEVWFWDLKKPLESRETFERMADYRDTVLVTFNFIGMSGESQFSFDGQQSIWDRYEIPCVCIMVDHPMYYHEQLSEFHKNRILCCVDKNHCRFTERFYPAYGKVWFVPLAGTELSQTQERDIDILFAGNYVAISDLLPHVAGMDEESRAYYFAIAEELIAHPSRTLEDVILEHLTRDFPDAGAQELLPVMHSMVFIDLYVRSFFRRKIVCSLAEAGLKVVVIGKDWEKAECKRPENLIQTGQLDSAGCLRYMRRANVALNIMPWFKNGAHDRIFNAMLQGCAVVTDSSEYLDGILSDGENAALFSLEQKEQLPEIVRNLLSDSTKLKRIADNGYELAKENHTWAHRAQQLLTIISETFLPSFRNPACE